MLRELTSDELNDVSGGFMISSSQTIRKIDTDKGTLVIIETQGDTPGNFRSTARWYPA